MSTGFGRKNHDLTILFFMVPLAYIMVVVCPLHPPADHASARLGLCGSAWASVAALPALRAQRALRALPGPLWPRGR